MLGTWGTHILAGTNGQLSVMAGANGRLQRGTFPPVVVFFVPNSAAFSPAELSACLPACLLVFRLASQSEVPVP